MLLDVREPWEIQTAAMPGIVSIPMREIPARSEELDDDAQIVCICHHGARSAQVAMFLESRGHATSSICKAGSTRGRVRSIRRFRTY